MTITTGYEWLERTAEELKSLHEAIRTLTEQRDLYKGIAERLQRRVEELEARIVELGARK